jgi:hypothetical protein
MFGKYIGRHTAFEYISTAFVQQTPEHVGSLWKMQAYTK